MLVAFNRFEVLVDGLGIVDLLEPRGAKRELQNLLNTASI